MAQLGRAATDQDILVSEHGRRFGIVGDGAAGNPSALILDGKVIASNRVNGPLVIPSTAGSSAGAVTLTGAVVGDRVGTVLDTAAALQVNVTANFESIISVKDQIQQTASMSAHAIVVYLQPGS